MCASPPDAIAEASTFTCRAPRERPYLGALWNECGAASEHADPFATLRDDKAEEDKGEMATR